MKVSMNWINDYVDLSGLDREELIHRFTLSTAEVEDVYHYGAEINGVVVAEIKTVEEHREALMRFLGDALKNDRFVLDVKVSEVPIDTPKILSPREVVEQIKQHNSGFNQFLKDFELGLA